MILLLLICTLHYMASLKLHLGPCPIMLGAIKAEGKSLLTSGKSAFNLIA